MGKQLKSTTPILKTGVCTAPYANVGGNWNNDLNCGPFYANLYNTPSNTNTNIGAALSFLMIRKSPTMQCISPDKTGKGVFGPPSSPLGGN